MASLNGFLKLDAQGTTNIRLAAIAMKALSKTEQEDISDWVNDELGGELKPLVESGIKTRLDSMVYSGSAKIRATGSSITLSQTVPNTKLRNGFILGGPNRPNGTPGYIANEFGGNREKVNDVSRRSKRGIVDYRRHTERQLPPRVRRGRVFYPAVERMMPRILAMIAQTSIRAYLDCFGDK